MRYTVTLDFVEEAATAEKAALSIARYLAGNVDVFDLNYQTVDEAGNQKQVNLVGECDDDGEFVPGSYDLSGNFTPEVGEVGA